jgi:hypothetical protein
MKRYVLFAGPTYYPAPGWCGMVETSDDLESLTETGKKKADDYYGWWQIVDVTTDEGTVVAGEGEGHTGLYGLFSASPPK